MGNGQHLAVTHKKRRQRAKKPLPEIEQATDALAQQGRAARNEHMQLIASIPSLTDDERKALLLSASNAFTATIVGIGFSTRLVDDQFRHRRAEHARRPISEKTTAWQAIAERLAEEQVEKGIPAKPFKIAPLIWERFQAECGENLITFEHLKRHLGKFLARLDSRAKAMDDATSR
ncbi:MAG: hypothetical protein CTY30_00835 [Methylocystis sp.]|nr:MAG: hypothetical protein CTY30_00835 [Methylocystis sp.]